MRCTGFFDRDVFFKLLIFCLKKEDFPEVKSFLRRLLIIILKFKIILYCSYYKFWIRATWNQALIFQLLQPILDKYFIMKGSSCISWLDIVQLFYDIVLEFYWDWNYHLLINILSQNIILKNNQHRQKKVWVMRSSNNALHILRGA